MENDDWRADVKAAVLDDEGFISMALSSPRGGLADGLRKISARPVLIKDGRHVQLSYFGPRQAVTRNLAGPDLARELDRVLALPFRQAHVQSASGDLHVRLTRDDKALVSRGKPSAPRPLPDLAHDRAKGHPIPRGRPDPLFEALGIMKGALAHPTADGQVKAPMQGKFRQVNEFLRVIEQTVVGQEWAAGGVSIVDCGCGKAYLTFAACHYLRDERGLAVKVHGVDVREDVIAQACALRDQLGWADMEFRVGPIAAFEPDRPPDVVLSLHACDTATDEALAQGVRWGARVILAAPCCQHELHDRLVAPPLRSVLHHGILRARLADVTTDAFRAAILRIMGYRTDVIEFVEPEATAKNLMIRAQRGLKPGNTRAVREYADLKDFWQVTPALEDMLGDAVRQYLPGA